MGNLWINHGLLTRLLPVEGSWYSTWALFPTRIGAAAPRPFRHPYLLRKHAFPFLSARVRNDSDKWQISTRPHRGFSRTLIVLAFLFRQGLLARKKVVVAYH